MTNFEAAVRVVLEHEGGYVNHKADPGGATNFGISLRWLRQQGDLDGIDGLDIDHDGDLDADDIKALSVADAKQFYFLYWWKRYGYNQIIDAGVATKIFDMAVNMGASQAHKLVQRAVTTAGFPVNDDGVLGPVSVRAVNSVDPNILIGAIRAEQKHFYLGLIAKRPDFEAFKTGWLKRAYS